MFRVTFSKETVKELKVKLQRAYECGDLRAVRRLSVLSLLGLQCTSNPHPSVPEVLTNDVPGIRANHVPEVLTNHVPVILTHDVPPGMLKIGLSS
jgi:hypothetical protein